MFEKFIGRKVIVRGDRSGVFFGTLKAVCRHEVELADCRRIWEWSGAASLHQLAADGVKSPEGCRFTVPVKEIGIIDAIEIIPCTEKASVCIEGVPEWKC